MKLIIAALVIQFLLWRWSFSMLTRAFEGSIATYIRLDGDWVSTMTLYRLFGSNIALYKWKTVLR